MPAPPLPHLSVSGLSPSALVPFELFSTQKSEWFCQIANQIMSRLCWKLCSDFLSQSSLKPITTTLSKAVRKPDLAVKQETISSKSLPYINILEKIAQNKGRQYLWSQDVWKCERLMENCFPAISTPCFCTILIVSDFPEEYATYQPLWLIWTTKIRPQPCLSCFWIQLAEQLP